MWLAAVHQLFFRFANIFQKTIRDIRVSEFVLDNRMCAYLGIGRGCVPCRHPVRRSTHQLCVRLHRQLYNQGLAISLSHFLSGLDNEAVLYLLLEFVLVRQDHRNLSI